MARFDCCPRWLNHDEYMTSYEAWADIKQFIPTNSHIWECFYGDGSSGKHLRDLGFQVYHEDIDFYCSNPKDTTIIVSNPPYSSKDKIFQRLKHLNKPFIMLVPTTCLHTKYFKECFENDPNLQLIIPYKKRQFTKVERTPDNQFITIESPKTGCAFYTLYVCWKVNLDRDIIFI